MINLISVIGHGTDLIPHFIEHYQNQVDQISFIVYESDLHPNLKREVREKIKEYRKVKIVGTVYDKVFDWEKVTYLYNEYKSKKPNEWWVIADIDEFHLYSHPLSKIIKDCEINGWRLVRGGFIDRIGKNGEFPELVRDENIFDQFPVAGFFRYPMSGACPNKISIAKGDVKITSGQHYAEILGSTTWRWQGWSHPLIAPTDVYSVQVHHFKWDKTCLDRIKSVVDVWQTYSYSHEYKMMYDAIINSGNKIDTNNPNFMFEIGCKNFGDYKKWNHLFKQIISI